MQPKQEDGVKAVNQDFQYQAADYFPMAVYFWEDEILEVLPCLTPPKYAPISALKFHTKITSKYYGDDYAAEVKGG